MRSFGRNILERFRKVVVAPTHSEVTQLRKRLNRLDRILASIHQVQVENYIDRLMEQPRYRDPLRLQRYGFKGTSQFDEDGILQEIFSRIGVTNRRFVEFGVGDGRENNTLYLLHQGWQGLWIEGNPHFASEIKSVFQPAMESGSLVLANSFLTKENINDVIESNGFSGEIDLLSIDVDGNDYHFWKELEVLSPRVVVVEYNVKFRPPMQWVMAYNPEHRFDKTDYCGASLKSLELLGKEKGYALVGCGLTGANAFFVRQHLVSEETFKAPFTAENHFEPCRYPLAWMYRSGMATGFGAHEAGLSASEHPL